ncbi:MAG: hypothetical protein RL885_21580 [Planctomycetota bacterium]
MLHTETPNPTRRERPPSHETPHFPALAEELQAAQKRLAKSEAARLEEERQREAAKSRAAHSLVTEFSYD